MHCEGGTEILKSPKYESLEISTADCIFLHRNTNCTKALDIALVLLPFKESYDYQNFEAQHGLALRTNSSVPHRNEDALFLFLMINPEDESWGAVISKRNGEVSSPRNRKFSDHMKRPEVNHWQSSRSYRQLFSPCRLL